MGMFIGRIEGPASPEEFAEGFVSQVQPFLQEREMPAAAWVDRSGGYFIHGFYPDGNQPPDLALINAALNWRVEITYLTRLLGLPPLGAVTRWCDMPHNPHAITDSAYKTCTNTWQQHHITDDHQVADCPKCGQPLI
ncbi:hypothetical protein ABZ557_27370 [Streptomyces sp. NPDC019645]|uniref:hypothetical protein n=1 Tax=Streptomyces sp. NPDC019645 TaxID=3154786 RepID=UPI0033CD3C73